MELRELRYFLAVANEESISKASETLYVTQPNLSRQMQKLEKELRQQLFIRGSRKITLTEAGRLLKKRAEELIELYDKTEAELTSPIDDISGDIYIGGGESYVLQIIAKTAHTIQADHPNVKIHLFSGDMDAVSEKLDKGLIDFGIFIEPSELSKYEYMRLPLVDTWGVLMRKDSPLASKEYLTPDDLLNLPIIRSRHSQGKSIIADWFNRLNVVATYNLLYNASLLVEQGVGYAVGLDNIINTTGNSNLCFKPFIRNLFHTSTLRGKRIRCSQSLPKYF